MFEIFMIDVSPGFFNQVFNCFFSEIFYRIIQRGLPVLVNVIAISAIIVDKNLANCGVTFPSRVKEGCLTIDIYVICLATFGKKILHNSRFALTTSIEKGCLIQNILR